jgi:hypothetical protein
MLTFRQTLLPSLCTVLALLGISLSTEGCGGGGGGDESGSGVGNGTSLLVNARVVSDTCGERLSDVQQIFSLARSGSAVVLDTSLIQLQMTSVDGALQGGFSETSGTCEREYSVSMNESGGGEYLVALKSTTTCPSEACATEWEGTAVPSSGSKELQQEVDLSDDSKVRGENCNANIPTDVGFRPSLFECNGNSAVLLRGGQRNNFSVVVRRNGQFNDRDPANPTCGTNRCSPFKTQKRIELPAYQVNCLGGSGFSDNYAGVQRISIKYTALITNANDTNQFEQYCLTDTTKFLN